MDPDLNSDPITPINYSPDKNENEDKNEFSLKSVYFNPRWVVVDSNTNIALNEYGSMFDDPDFEIKWILMRSRNSKKKLIDVKNYEN